MTKTLPASPPFTRSTAPVRSPIFSPTSPLPTVARPRSPSPTRLRSGTRIPSTAPLLTSSCSNNKQYILIEFLSKCCRLL
ncbi:hypothetical protein KSP40_PGU008485 [Platanthera guangdongensis]|uniref:Uncharacterized protein n=1 Tax=Platanthera guangdongensis TaxID=2320717 RepID=A0ABR2LGB8_9ASPA